MGLGCGFLLAKTARPPPKTAIPPSNIKNVRDFFFAIQNR